MSLFISIFKFVSVTQFLFFLAHLLCFFNPIPYTIPLNLHFLLDLLSIIFFLCFLYNYLSLFPFFAFFFFPLLYLLYIYYIFYTTPPLIQFLYILHNPLALCLLGPFPYSCLFFHPSVFKMVNNFFLLGPIRRLRIGIQPNQLIIMSHSPPQQIPPLPFTNAPPSLPSHTFPPPL